MQQRPRVTIITPAYNAAEHISETIQSVVEQTWSDWEWLIVDDGSRDSTRSIVEEANDDRIRLIQLPHSGLPAVVRNAAVAEARGEFIAFIDADDIWVPDKLATQVAYLEGQPSVGLVFSTYYHWRAGTAEPPVVVPQTEGLPNPGDYFALEFNQNVIGNSTVIVRRSLLDVHGHLDEDPQQRGTEDYELWLRLAPHTFFGFVERPLVWYRVHPASLSGKQTRIARGRILALEKALKRNPALYDDPRFVNTRLSAEKLAWLGFAQIIDGNAGAARETLLRSLRVWPFDVRVWKMLASSFIERHHYLRLKQVFRRR